MHAKRIWAWVGIAYAVIANILIFYMISTGKMLTGITGVMAFPALAGAMAYVWDQHRTGERFQSAFLTGYALFLLGVALAASVVFGVRQLLALAGGV